MSNETFSMVIDCGLSLFDELTRPATNFQINEAEVCSGITEFINGTIGTWSTGFNFITNPTKG